MNIEFFKNKRLQFVLAVIWLVVSFIIVRAKVVNAAKVFLSVSSYACTQKIEYGNFSDCMDVADKKFAQLYKVTEIQLIDTFMLFIAPIILIILTLSLVKWIKNYKN